MSCKPVRGFRQPGRRGSGSGSTGVTLPSGAWRACAVSRGHRSGLRAWSWAPGRCWRAGAGGTSRFSGPGVPPAKWGANQFCDRGGHRADRRRGRARQLHRDQDRVPSPDRRWDHHGGDGDGRDLREDGQLVSGCRFPR